MATNIVLLCLYLLSSSSFIQNIAAATRNGFTIKLIHRDSVESPLYPGNLTFQENLARLYNQSNYHLSYMSSLIKSKANSSENIHPEAYRSTLVFQDLVYLAEIGIGDIEDGHSSLRILHLVADTGSDQVWTQCEKCIDCFPQAEQLFPCSQSLSCHPLPCNKHPLCDRDQCDGGLCSYTAAYLAGSYSSGFLATESFTFDADQGKIESVDNIVFGCGIHQVKFRYGPGNTITGVLGLGHGSRSFITQLADRANGRFSYCLPPWTQPWAPGSVVRTFLRFGDDAQFKQGQHVSTTPLLIGKYLKVYYVNLLDISVGGRRLNFAPNTFALKADGNGGCALDIGSSLTHLHRKPYNVLRSAVVAYMAGYRLQTIQVKDYDLCYRHSNGPLILPVITFHFTSADWAVGAGAFLATPEYFCLAIVPHDYTFISMIIGNHLQTSHRFMYDVNALTLSFAQEECGAYA